MNVLDNIAKFVMKIIFRIKINNIENIPENGGAIICSNHISNWDPVILYLCLPRKARFLAKIELYDTKFITKFLNKRRVIPINREKPEFKSIKETINTIKAGDLLGIFPQGTRKKELKEEDVKNGLAFIAYSTNADVIPIKIVSNYKLFSKVNIFIGKPIKPKIYKEDNKKENYDLFSKEIVHIIKELGNESHSS